MHRACCLLGSYKMPRMEGGWGGAERGPCNARTIYINGGEGSGDREQAQVDDIDWTLTDGRIATGIQIAIAISMPTAIATL